jgi:DNA replication protein DnaC
MEGVLILNKESINEAFDRISERRNNAISTYNKHVEEVENKVPEIAYLNREIANTCRNIIVTCLKNNTDVKTKIEKIRDANLYAQQKTTQLLKQFGYPEDYLQINYTCPKCSDTGYFNDDYCQCVVDLVKQINAEYVNKNSKLKLSSFESFNLEYYSKSRIITRNNQTFSEYDLMKQNFLRCKEYVRKFSLSDNTSSIIMFGRTGLGKTHLSLAMARGILERGYTVIYNSTMDMFSAIEKEKFGKDINSANDTLESILSVDLLIIDDLGIEYDNKFFKTVLYNIINTRSIRSLPTIISTNLNIDELEIKYEERIFSRLMTYEFMPFFGTDIRRTAFDNKYSK